jgi:hypothetical protein
MSEVNEAQRHLARRLRELRGRWPDIKVTQSQLARAFGGTKPVSVPLISSWESQGNPKIPPPQRLDCYATFFATARSVDDPGNPRLLSDSELTAAELAAKTALSSELAHLRASALQVAWPAGAAAGTAPVAAPSGASAAVRAEEAEMIASLNSGYWRFSDGRSIAIVSAQLPEDMLRQIPYSDPMDPDYVALYKYADLDALVELHGHIRAANPGIKHVSFRSAEELVRDDYTTHLVSLGGVEWNHATQSLFAKLDLPVRQVADWDSPQGPYFEVNGDGAPQRFYPSVRMLGDKEVLREDVALFARAVNPFNKLRTATICNGMYASGTFGAVRALTDERFRDRNASYAKDRFGQCEAFCVLTRVQVERGVALTPDWTLPENILFEWMRE